MNKFNSIVAGALDIAHTEAMERKNTEVYPIHLLWGLYKNPASFLSRQLKTYEKKIKETLSSLPQAKEAVAMDQLRANAKLSEWLTRASSQAIQSGTGEVSETDLLRFMPQFFPELDLNIEEIMKDQGEDEEVPSFLVNLNEMAEEGRLDPVIGRSKEIRAVMEILGRRSKNNPVLVGPAGVGKTAIVEGLALAILKNQVPDVLKGKIVYALDMGALMAGTKFRGEFEERLQNLIKFLKGQSGQAILFIDEMHQLVGAGKTDGAMDAANLLKPALARGELNCIGATTYDEYKKYILGDSALDRRFRPVPVDEPSISDSIEILMGLKDKLEAHHGIKISDNAIFNAVTLSDQYITNKNLPDKAIDLVDEASSALKLSAEAMPPELSEMEANIKTLKIRSQFEGENVELVKEISKLEKTFEEQREVWSQEVLSMKKMSELTNQLDRYRFELEQAERTADYEAASLLKYSVIPEIEGQLESTVHEWSLSAKDIAMVINRQTGIPLEKILKDQQDNILELEAHLNGRVFGQSLALHEIAETLLTSHAGLKDETKPLGSFLLRGPSGVGKTETAKALAEFLFDTEKNIIRMDMSEFSEKHSVSKLIGAPAGYVGYEEGGILTEAVRLKPYSVLLFDEIEKAHPDFSDILLQILDDGRLTDNKGRTIDFKNTIIFLTTNSKNLEMDFKPEVLGRIDAILDFKALDSSVMKDLVAKQLAALNERLASKKIELGLGEELVRVLSDKGYDEKYGARPLANIFNQMIIRPLSRKLLQGELKEGNLKASWKADKGLVTFKS
jgi:ATP-dependent Clp protease ATP-binding subunit ClpB